MTALGERLSLDERVQGRGADGTTASLVASLVFVLMAVAGWRDGGFWHTEALAIAVIGGVLLVAAVIVAPPDRAGLFVLTSLGLLALWWYLRTVTAAPGAEFLPLGASIIGCAAAFAAVRPLTERACEDAALAVAFLGAVGALVGFAGLTWRWSPMAIPAQGLWRLSSSVTYADAAGLAFAMCLLVALGCSRTPALIRVAVCLNFAALIATQSRGASVAVLCTCLLVPLARYRDHALPLSAGAVLGVAAVASSPQGRPVPWLVAVTVGAVIVSAWDGRGLKSLWSRIPTRAVVGGTVVCGLVGAALLLRHEIGLRTLAPSDQDRSAEWTSAWHQFASAPFIGVGADRPLILHAVDGSSAQFVHNEYLQVAADGGAVGLGLLAFVALSLGKVLRAAPTRCRHALWPP